jgi:WD40 repeat protein
MNGELVRTFYGHTAPVRSFTVMQDDPALVVTCSEDRTMRQWSLVEPGFDTNREQAL